MAELIDHRADFPALQEFVWFDNGVVSLTPIPVADELRRSIDEVVRRGPPHVTHPEEEHPRRLASRDRIARFLGASTDDIALTRGVGDAFLTVLRGIDWRSGDELIISDDEDAALLLPAMHVRDSHGVRLLRMPAALEPPDLVRALGELLTDRTRLLAFSHVTTNRGCTLPVAQLCQLARDRGVLSFVDLAQSAGLLTIDLNHLGCDFAAALSYKWMYGPYAAGVLWARPRDALRIALRFAGNRTESSIDEQSLRYELRDTTQRFDYGPWSWPVIHAWATAADYVDDVGRKAIWARTAELAKRLKGGLAAINGVSVLTPIDEARSAGLVTFTMDGLPGETASQALRTAYNIRIKHVPSIPNALRASVAFFNLESEIEELQRAVAQIMSQHRR